MQGKARGFGEKEAAVKAYLRRNNPAGASGGDKNEVCGRCALPHRSHS